MPLNLIFWLVGMYVISIGETVQRKKRLNPSASIAQRICS